MNNATFEYFYGKESCQYQFYCIPKALMRDPRFKHLSNDAKLLYTLMLDRMSLSALNGWYDHGKVFIYFTLREIQEVLNCGSEKGMKLLAELDTKKGIGLIERVKQGQGKPTRIFVKRFTHESPPPTSDDSNPEQNRFSNAGTPRSKTYRLSEAGPMNSAGADCGKPKCNKTDKNQTDFIHTDQSIHQSRQRPMKRTGRRKRRAAMGKTKTAFSKQPPSTKAELRTIPQMIQSAPRIRSGKNKSHHAIHFLDRKRQQTVLRLSRSAFCAAASASMSFGSPNDPCQGHSPSEPQTAEINRTVRFVFPPA